MPELPDTPISEFVPGRLTKERLNELVERINALCHQVNSLRGELENLKTVAAALPVKITAVIAVGRYSATAYLPPYVAQGSTSALAAADLNSRTVDVVLWNLAELSGASPLAVDAWVDATPAGF